MRHGTSAADVSPRRHLAQADYGMAPSQPTRETLAAQPLRLAKRG